MVVSRMTPQERAKKVVEDVREHKMFNVDTDGIWELHIASAIKCAQDDAANWAFYTQSDALLAREPGTCKCGAAPINKYGICATCADEMVDAAAVEVAWLLHKKAGGDEVTPHDVARAILFKTEA
jgi:hypothetical protein